MTTPKTPRSLRLRLAALGADVTDRKARADAVALVARSALGMASRNEMNILRRCVGSTGQSLPRDAEMAAEVRRQIG